MTFEPRDAPTSAVEVGTVGHTGFWLLVDDRELYLSFDWFPWFQDVTMDALTTIERPSSNHLYWPKLDADVAIAFIEHPTAQDRELPFSKAAHRLLALAGEEAQRLGHPYIGTEHLVLALTRAAQGVLRTALSTLGVDEDRVRRSIETTVNTGSSATTSRRLSYTSTVKRAMKLAKDSAQGVGQGEISVEHLLVGVLRARGVGAAVLGRHGLSETTVLDVLRRIGTDEGPIGHQ